MTINALPDDDYLKHQCYAAVWSGVDLFTNQALVPKTEARSFRRKGKFHTKRVPHIFHTYLREKMDLTDPQQLMRADKWWPAFKNIPQDRNDRAPQFTTPPQIMQKYGSFLAKEVAKDVKVGTMIRTEPDIPIHVTAWVVADEEGRKLRKCFDGGLLKILETEKTVCVLDTIPQFCDMLKPNDFMTKTDDKSGFFQLLLNGMTRKTLINLSIPDIRSYCLKI